MTRGVSTSLPTALPARYRTRFAWQLDRRSKVVREVAADLVELWQDLGGYEGLSKQQQWLCERVVFMRRRVLAYEAAVMHNLSRKPDQPELPLPIDSGTYSNHVNVLLGLLRVLGLDRRIKNAKSLQDFMRNAAPARPAPIASPVDVESTPEPVEAPQSAQAAATHQVLKNRLHPDVAGPLVASVPKHKPVYR